jgi:hypothetical protein
VSRGNCFFASLIICWRLRHRRGRWWVRPSDHIAGWHWGWQSRDCRYTLHYEPLEPKRMPAAVWHKVWYRGRLVRGDQLKDKT